MPNYPLTDKEMSCLVRFRFKSIIVSVTLLWQHREAALVRCYVVYGRLFVCSVRGYRSFEFRLHCGEACDDSHLVCGRNIL